MATIGIDTRLTYYRRGGIGGYMRQLVSALAAVPLPHEVKILHHFRDRQTSDFQHVKCLTPCHHRLESWALGLELLPRRLDLLHSPDFIPPRFGAKKFVITIHDLAFLLFEDIQTKESLRYYAGNIRRAVDQASRIIAVSEATKNDLVRLLGTAPDRVDVVWEGVHPAFQLLDADRVRACRKKYDLPEDYILFVGTIEPRKNLLRLIEAYTHLQRRLPDMPSLVLVGQKGWLVDDILPAMHRAEGVTWLANVPFEDLPALYNGALVHVLPSLYEGFGFPMLEAMACGTPSVVSNGGALREIGGEAAVYVDPNFAESIAEGIETVLRDSGLAQRHRQSGIRHAQTFTWRRTAEQTVQVYEAALVS